MSLSIDEAIRKFTQDIAEAQRRMLAGMDHLLSIGDVEVNRTPKVEVYKEDKVKVFHYETEHVRTCPVPVLICYALVNRYYMMDLQEDRSLIQNLLAGGLDLYVIDWGYPSTMDAHITMEDYIDEYLDAAVDCVRARSGFDQINLLGVCQGGTFSAIYTATHPQKIRNLITMVTPIDFHTDEGLLNIWAQDMNIDALVDTYGAVPGWFMNFGFLMLKPFQLMVDKYVSMLDIMDDPDALENFVRMEKWIFDSPAQAGEAYRKFLKDLYQENRIIKGTFELGGRTVDLKRIRCPLLNIFGTKDHLVPPSSSRPFTKVVGSTDVESFELPIGHIGMYVSSKSQTQIAPRIIEWLQARSGDSVSATAAGSQKASAGKGRRKTGNSGSSKTE